MPKSVMTKKCAVCEINIFLFTGPSPSKINMPLGLAINLVLIHYLFKKGVIY